MNPGRVPLRWPLLLAVILVPPAAGVASEPRVERLASPDGHLSAELQLGEQVRYSLALDGRVLVSPSVVSMTLAGGRQLGRAEVLRVERTERNDVIETPLGKRARVRDAHRELAVRFADGATLRARLFDDGFALRWETSFRERIRVLDEGFSVAFPEEPRAFFLGGDGAHHGYEGLWRHEPISAIGGWSLTAAALPLVFDLPGGPKLGLIQADLDDYPALYLTHRPSQPRTLVSLFPRRVAREQPGGYLDFGLVAAERADDLAETAGTRSFPWRAFVLARRDADLAANDLVWRLGPTPQASADFGWVEPGKVVWDYWADWNLTGVDFVAGRNTRTFEHHVDFAARHGFRYVNIDWLWTDPHDLDALNPDIDVPHIVRYARERGVRVFVWCLARTLERQLGPFMDRMQQWGVAGLKIDFFDRDDQRMVALYRRFAEEAARRRLLVLFHGATAPSGLSRAFPNVVGYEAVRGLEYDKFDEKGAPPDHDAMLPFTRMLAGPLDYTPGAMRTLPRGVWRANGALPFGQGTVAHQLALYVVYDAPLVMLSDMPSAYEREPAALELLREVPTTWDETVGVDGRIGEWVAIARRKGEEWWLAAITDWNPRRLELPLAFLGGGAWEAVSWTDGPNAARAGEDYRRRAETVEAARGLTLDLAAGGGAVVRLRRR